MHAETGSITIVDEKIKFNIDTTATGGGIANFSHLAFRNQTYNRLYTLTVKIPATVSFSSPSNSTTFQIIKNGSGSGVVTYTQADRNITWYCGLNGCDITGAFPEFTYGDGYGFWYQLSYTSKPGQTDVTDGLAATDNDPVIWCANAYAPVAKWCSGGGANVTGEYTVDLGSSVTNSWTLTYPFTNAFRLSVTKDAQIQTDWSVYSQNNATFYYFENLGVQPFNFTYYPQGAGIIANMSIASGRHSIVTLNASGTTPTSDTSPPVVDPVTGVGIKFDFPTYSIGGTANISWLRTNPTPFGYIDDIYLTQPGDIKKILVSSPPNSGFIKTNDFPVAGEYKITFERSVLGLFPEILASDTANVLPPQPSYIVVNSTVPANYPFNFTWLLGYTPALQTVINGIEIYQVSSGQLVDTCYNSNIVANTEYVCTATVPAEGDYKIILKDIQKGNVVTVFTTALQQYNPPKYNITISRISIDKTTYYRGDDMQISFEIDSFNYSNYMTFYSFWNTTNHLNVANHQLSGKQSGTTDNVLGTYLDDWDFTRRISGTGAYNISLMAKNDSAEFVLISTPFTFIDANRRGISMTLKNKTVCSNDAQIISYVITENVTLRIQESSSGKTVAQYNISESGSLRYKNTKTGVYLVSLQAADGTLQALDDYKVIGTCDVLPGEFVTTWKPRNEDVGISCAVYENYVIAAFPGQGVNDVTRFEFALLVIGVVMVVSAVLTNNFGIGVIVGFVPYAFFLFLSLSSPCGQFMPVWTGFFIALIIAAKMRFF